MRPWDDDTPGGNGRWCPLVGTPMRAAMIPFLVSFACSERDAGLPAAEPTRSEPIVALAAAPASAAREPVVEPASVVPELRVVTYNILAGNYGVGEVIVALRSLDADVVALQEVDRDTRRSGRVDQPSVIAEALGMEVAFAHHRRYDGGQIGVALLSRYALANVRRIALPGGGLAALDAEVRLASDVVRVLVVHLHPTDPRDSVAKQAKMDAARLREARAVLDLAGRSTGPTIVLGDFNARASGPEYAAFARVLSDACPGGDATWPATFPIIRIDYVWTSTGLRSLGCPRFAPSASDHRPVVVDLALARG